MARKKSAAKKAREQEKSQQTNAEVLKEVKKVKILEPEEKKNILSDDEEDEDSNDSSDSEEEDEFGELITGDVEEGINKVLNAIKSGDQALFDRSVKFFEDPEQAALSVAKKEVDKPIYLKDYHRMNLLSGDALKDDDELESENWPEGEKPIAIQQREEKSQLLSEIKDAFNDDEDEDEDDEDDGFLKRKEEQRRIEPMRRLPDPEQDGEKFLEAYMGSQAWIPTKDDKEINLDDRDDDEFDDAVETFEQAYNFRYEDPKSAEIVSYARNQATLRRSKTNPRKLLREREQEEKNKEKQKKEAELNKKKLKKINMVSDRLSQIKQAVGEEVSDELIAKVFGDSLLKDDFDDADWDSKMAQIFDEAYYDAEPTKPDFGDDDEIMKDFGEKEEEEDEEEVEDEEEEEEEIKEEQTLTKKDQLKVKKSKRKEKDTIKKVAEKIVLTNTAKLVEEIEQDDERGRSKQDDLKFKYREVSPESFGLTTREILAAQDKDLNELIGIKKFAPYRPRELRMKDKRKLTKSYKVKEWKKKVFRNSKGLEIGDDVEIGFKKDNKKRKHNTDDDNKKNTTEGDSNKKHKKDKKNKKKKKDKKEKLLVPSE